MAEYLSEEKSLRDLKTNSSRYEFTIHTYGCKVNTYDTGLLEGRLRAAGNVRASHSIGGDEGAPRRQVHILNTCAVTSEATREAVKTASKIKASNPNSILVVTGCGAQVDGEIFDQLPAADLVVANSHKGQLEEILDRYLKGEENTKTFRSNIFQKKDLEDQGGTESTHTRSFLKIQDGCNSFCTYCVIPFARGRSRSVSIANLVAKINALKKNGVQEVVLTGVHIGDYEDADAPEKADLADLVERILGETTMPRIRLSSLEPVELDDRLLRLYEDPRLCRHFHMSIQSASSKVLRAMRRNYDAIAVEVALEQIYARIPDAFVGMDVIVGFPGESDDDFAETLMRLDRLPWTRIHVFPYSERPGTKANELPESVAPRTRKLRAERLRQLSSERYAKIASQQIGKNKQVLFLSERPQGFEAISRDYWPVVVTRTGAAHEDLFGREMTVKISGVEEQTSGRMVTRLLAESHELTRELSLNKANASVSGQVQL